jgi:hypothetical protein
MKLTTLSLLLALVAAVYAAPVRADDGKWKKEHPRRAEVNKRTKNQRKRVAEGETSGELTKAQGDQIKKEDRGVRKEERRMAAKDGGHITKADQAKLNHRENHISNQIKKDEAGNTAPAPAAPAPAPAGQ